MQTLRTPDEYFDNLPDYDFEPHYLSFGGLRVHYLDEGPDTEETILCLHGDPTWSYLYRKMIPVLGQQYRVIAPDFIGFGRSDKFTDPGAYSFAMHYHTLARIVEDLELEAITLVCQDWGGLLGLTLAAEIPDAFDRLVIMNTALPTGEEPLSEAFLQWQAFAANHPDLAMSKIIARGLSHPERISADALAGYDAPFPDASYKTGAAIWPSLVPGYVDDPGAAEMRRTRQALTQWPRPALVMFSDGDPITAGWDKTFLDMLPTARDFGAVKIEGAGHFLQEEKGEEIAAHILRFMAATPLE